MTNGIARKDPARWIGAYNLILGGVVSIIRVTLMGYRLPALANGLGISGAVCILRRRRNRGWPSCHDPFFVGTAAERGSSTGLCPDVPSGKVVYWSKMAASSCIESAVALVRLAPLRSAPKRRALVRSQDVRSAFARFACEKSAPAA